MKGLMCGDFSSQRPSVYKGNDTCLPMKRKHKPPGSQGQDIPCFSSKRMNKFNPFISVTVEHRPTKHLMLSSLTVVHRLGQRAGLTVLGTVELSWRIMDSLAYTSLVGVHITPLISIY
jgi:hypothetical protein